MIFARKMPEFYIIIAPKNIFSRILGGLVSLPSCLLCLWPGKKILEIGVEGDDLKCRTWTVTDRIAGLENALTHASDLFEEKLVHPGLPRKWPLTWRVCLYGVCFVRPLTLDHADCH